MTGFLRWPGAVDLLVELVKAPSISGSEEAALEVLQAALQSENIAVEGRGRNIVARHGEGAPELWLCTHIDTVKPAQGWSFDPWSGELINGRVLGLGANDAKGSVAAMAQAFVDFGRAHPNFKKGSLVLAIACDEETGGEGVERLLREMPAPTAAIVGEPNNLLVANCCKGLVRAYVQIEGKSAHASRPWQGESAVRRMLPAMQFLCADHEFPSDPVLGLPTLEVTIVEAGTQKNVLPAAAHLTLDGRTTPAYGNADMVALLRSGIAPLPGCDLVIGSDRLNATRTPEQGRLVQAALAARGQERAGAFPSVCDFVFLGGSDAVVMGPGQPERSHRADEYLLVGELSDGVECYSESVRRYFELEPAP